MGARSDNAYRPRADCIRHAFPSANFRLVELTILMPCLNEAETIRICIDKAMQYLRENGIDGEVLISDNGSSDGSQEIARSAGARVVVTRDRGYGAALLNGISEARGDFIIMGDADDSYDFSSLDDFVTELRNGADLVIGDRFAGGIEPGAMPPLHRYLGNPVLSAIGRTLFSVGVRDFHCGQRGFCRQSIQRLGLRATGMEFASEMIVKATLMKLTIVEVPVVLYPDGRTRKPHLRTWRDGWRHLRFLLLYSPRWLFLYPGLLLVSAGGIASIALSFSNFRVGNINFDINTLMVTVAAVMVGYQAIWFALLSKVFASREGMLPGDTRVRWLRERFPLGLAIAFSALMSFAGIVGFGIATQRWAAAGWGPLDMGSTLRLVIPSVAVIVLSAQTLLSSFMLSILSLSMPHDGETVS